MTEGQEKSTPQPTIAKWMSDAAEEIENGLWEWIGWDGYECGVAGSFARKAAYSIAANFALRSVAGGEPTLIPIEEGWVKFVKLHFGESEGRRIVAAWESFLQNNREFGAGGEPEQPSVRFIWAASPDIRELLKEIVAVGQPYLEDCDEIGMKDGGWKAKMPKLSQWLSICARAKRLYDKAKLPAPPQGKEQQ